MTIYVCVYRYLKRKTEFGDRQDEVLSVYAY